MANGGARPGAGRKPGGKNKRTQEIAIKAAQEGATPIEVMLGAMRLAWDEAQKVDDFGERVKAAKAAADIAKEAAPYVHPKMAPKPADDGTGSGYTVFKVGGILNGNFTLTPDASRGPDGPVEAKE